MEVVAGGSGNDLVLLDDTRYQRRAEASGVIIDVQHYKSFRRRKAEVWKGTFVYAYTTSNYLQPTGVKVVIYKPQHMNTVNVNVNTN